MLVVFLLRHIRFQVNVRKLRAKIDSLLPTYGGARVALFDLFRQCQIEQPPSFLRTLK